MIQQSHSWTYIQRKLSSERKRMPQCSPQHYVHELRHGNNLKVHNRGRDKEDTNEYYSAIKRNEKVTSAEMWMDLETTIQSEVSQREK